MFHVIEAIEQTFSVAHARNAVDSAELFILIASDLCHRGLAAGIYTTNSPEACHYVASNCDANILVVENQKQLDKILQVRRHYSTCP